MIETLHTKSVIRKVLTSTMTKKFIDEDQLAARAKLSTLTVRHICDPEDVSLPALKTLIKVCNALDISIGILFEE